MSALDDSLPAFPQNPDCLAVEETGMTLRDYFAAKAMQGMIAMEMDIPFRDYAIKAYVAADAMLEARKK